MIQLIKSHIKRLLSLLILGTTAGRAKPFQYYDYHATSLVGDRSERGNSTKFKKANELKLLFLVTIPY